MPDKQNSIEYNFNECKEIIFKNVCINRIVVLIFIFVNCIQDIVCICFLIQNLLESLKQFNSVVIIQSHC